MRPNDLREWQRRQPFQPFRLHVLETTAFEVRHPEMILVKRSTVDLFLPATRFPIPIAERRETIALLHIPRLEPILKTTSLTDGA